MAQSVLSKDNARRSVRAIVKATAVALAIGWAVGPIAAWAQPEPSGWYAGDMHVHRSCGGGPVPVSTIYNAMVAQNVSVVSLLADMGNAEVKDPVTDLPLVNGGDDPISTAGRIIHWDAEWHWDATYTTYPHQALGGHLVNLGLSEAHQIWDEYTYPITQWVHQQGGISGFAHMQYQDNTIPTSLNCCLPIEYPVEVALGGVDFISEDVNGSESAVAAYYRLLNCGFRPGFAAGSDYPCGASIGPLITYAQVDGALTYRKWIDAIARGRTVVSRDGHNEFLNLQVNGTATPGDEIKLTSAGDVSVTVQWTANSSMAGTIELVKNGAVVATQTATASPGTPGTLTATVNFPASGWLCARLTKGSGHVLHTAAVFVTVAGAPVRASADDANFFVNWISTLITNTSTGGSWNSFFPTELAAAQARYQAAKAIYQQIAAGSDVAPFVAYHAPGAGATDVAVGASVTATFSEPVDPLTVTTSTVYLAPTTTATLTYDAGAHTVTLTPASPLAYSTLYTVTVKGGATGVKDPAGTAMTADAAWSFTTKAQDLVAPEVTSTSPAAGATGIVPTTTVSAVFSEALNASSVSGSTFLLSPSVTATVSYDAASRTATLTPGSMLSPGTYTATLKGGTTGDRITDVAGNALASDYTWPFTVTAFNCPCTVWSPTTVPGTVTDPDASANELGLKFRASVNGWITGVRFYKSSTNTGTHIGNLWSASGTLLATATFTGETASGWQEVSFGTPVAIIAGTTYVVSYHTNTGHYSEDDNYFTAALVSGPLRALANGEDGPNGVYAKSSASTFPNTGYQSSNYWVDPIFATSVGPDITHPTVVSHVPTTDATGVAVGAAVTVTMSEALDGTTVSGSTFELRGPGSALVPAEVSNDMASRTVTLRPTNGLAYTTIYTATIKGGASGVKDLAGNELEADVTWQFTTSSPPPPPPSEGPGGPILVISTATNPFSRYFAEILRAEGLNEFTAMDLSLVTPTVLGAYDVVILGEMSLTVDQVAMLADWTNLGGTLIAMRPDAQLAELLGITRVSGTLANQYLLVNTASGPGAGIVGQTIQFHGTADFYTMNVGTTSLATLYSNATTATAYPAVTSRDVGSNGGKAVAFTYDLARSVVYTRQGNPAWAGQKRDGQIEPIRSDDLFFGNASFDPQPDWVNLDKVAIPQADEQQRLLANVITLANLHRKPLPRLWYLPKGLKAAVVMTGDDHGDAGMRPRFDIYMQTSPDKCKEADWECVRATGYLYLGGTFPDSAAARYESYGFETAPHIDTGCARATPSQYETFVTNQVAAFRNAYPSLVSSPVTNRNHCIAWSDWSSVAEVEAAHGIRLDTNYYYWPYSWFLGRIGHFTGSGMPMRFAKLDGTIIDCYQANTQLTDDALGSFTGPITELLSRAQGPEGYYAVVTCNLHFDDPDDPGSREIVTVARSRGVPVVSAKQMLAWLDGRNNSSFANLVWGTNTLSFSIVAATGSRNMRAMLPNQAKVGQLTGITKSGTPIDYTTQVIKGIEYAFFPAEGGDYVATYLVDETAPLITNVVATPHDDGTATITWTTNEASDSRVDYGLTSGTLDLNVIDATLVKSHSVTLSGLAPSKTYYYRVTSTDAASNDTTEPPTGSAPLSFTTPAPVCALDATAAQFAQGTTGANTYVTTMADGEVILATTFAQDFGGTTLPTGWLSGSWPSAGAVAVAGGQLVVDGAYAYPPQTFGPGGSIEFAATFRADGYQNVGFSSGGNFGEPWVAIGTGIAGGGVYARTNGGTDISLGSGLLGAPHRYRIDWAADSFVFYVDGTQAATLSRTVTGPLYVTASDYNNNSTTLQVDWLRGTPYVASGSFLSRVFDTGGTAQWDAASWTADLPAGTGLAIYVRKGEWPTPNETWTEFTLVPASGTSVGGSSRYLQYRADLSTANTAVTPVLRDMHVSCTVGEDTSPPLISGIVAIPAGSGVSALITWSTNESADSYVDFGTAPGSLLQNAGSPSRVLSHSVSLTGLSPSTNYYFRVRSTDAANNGRTEPPAGFAPLSFSTSALTCFVDDTATDFGGGTPVTGTVVVAEAGNGEVTLKPGAGSDFTVLPPTSEWQTFALNTGGTATISSGQLLVDGARVNSEPIATTYGPGTRLECMATFNAVQHQYIGFGGGDDAVGPTGVFYGPPWAMFGTGAAGTQVYARVYAVGGSMIDYTIPLSLLGTAHKYRIDWKTDVSGDYFDFYVDDGLVHSETITLPAMRVAMSDLSVGAPTLNVDWLRVTPYPASGSFLSRVYDAGASTTWGNITWMATLPAGTSIQMATRVGSTATPDATWTPFTPAASSGATVGGASRYLQYRAVVATTDTYLTPSLENVQVTCNAGTDGTAPIISSVTATAGAGGKTATVAWGTNELATSRVDYGTAADALTLNASNASLVGTHALSLSGVTASTTYYYRVTSTDGAGNSTTEPPLASPPLSFVTQSAPCASDATVADFAGGATGSATYVSETTDGEVILKPTVGAEFSGTELPTGWMSGVYGGSPAVVGGGHVSVDGAYAATTAFYGAGRTVEFVATFDATANLQHVGFGDDLNNAPWAIFSTDDGGTLEARSNNGTDTKTTLSSSWLGAPHRFRIDWGTSQIVYWIDGTVVATHDVAIATSMRPIVGDGPVGGNPLQADWVRMTPYPASGSYTSRVFDGGGTTTWKMMNWTSSVPTNTSLSMFERHGNTPVPDGTWTGFTAIPGSGTDLAAAGRFLQYRADLATSDVAVTPALMDVAIACTSTPDNAPPVITNVAATPATGGVAATVTWTTDELANSRVDYGTASGSLTSFVTDVGFVTSHSLLLSGLSPGTTYYYRVTSTDVATNSASSPASPNTLSFTTLAAPCPSDVTLANFALGTLDANLVTSSEGDGELILKPALIAEFSGTSVPTDWHAGLFGNGGTAGVSGGQITVNGAHASSNASFGPGCSLEFVATFTPTTFQNVGFAGDSLFNKPWMVIGQGSATDGVYARTYTNVSTLLSATALGSPHRYRIDWNGSPTNNFVFYLDGIQVTTISLAISTNMVAMISDYNVGGNAVSVDWLRVSPYAASGTFLSRVFDGYGPTNWGAVTWTASTPTGTGLSVYARTGNTPTPSDGSWSPYDLLTNGAAVGANSRYVQYRADLTSTSPSYATPVLKDLAIACVSGPDLTAPVISDVTAVPASNGQSATVTWTTDERSTSRVDYGTNPEALGLNVSDAGRIRSHSLALTGLTPGVTYYYRVTSADASGNSATQPSPPSAPRSFTTPMQPCFVDQSAADFGAGTLTNAAVSIVTDGEVILAPALGSEFSGTSLPTDWSWATWTGGGTATVSGGALTVDGAHAYSNSSFGPGRSLEFVATYRGGQFQNVGLATDGNFGSPWVAIGMGSDTSGVFARMSDGTSTLLSSSTKWAPHRYRITWSGAPTNTFAFYVDGTLVTTLSFAVGGNMVALVSDYNVGGNAVTVDWLRMTPYASIGTFVSRVYDGGGPISWGTANWTVSLPTNTTLALSVRGGNAASTSDPSWTAWASIASSGGSVGLCTRYLQYKAELGTTDVGVTPALQDVSITCAPGADLTAVTDLAAAPATAGVVLTWSGGGGGGGAKVYRKGYGGYPTYGGGAEPARPASPAAAVDAGWALTGVTASGQTDQPSTRDYWYYVLFKTDVCSNASPVSNLTGGTLNYLLGDVSDGLADCAGNNLVNMGDVSLLGTHYGATQSEPGSGYLPCLDVGPTTDFGVHSRPQPDGVLEFEDLVLYALNFTLTGAPEVLPVAKEGGSRPAAAAADAIALTVPALPQVGETFAVAVRGSGKGDLQALSLALDYDRSVVEMVGAEAGQLLGAQAAPAMVLSPKAGRVDVALLGQGVGLTGEGELATVSFKVLAAGDPKIRIATADGRDGKNQKVVVAGAAVAKPVLPTVTRLTGAKPNPFSQTVTVAFSLAAGGPVDLTLYSVDGRKVRTLAHGIREPGEYSLVWDGRDGDGNAVAAGVYYARLMTPQGRFNRTLTYLR